MDSFQTQPMILLSLMEYLEEEIYNSQEALHYTTLIIMECSYLTPETEIQASFQ